MTESQREIVPRIDGGELQTGLSFLRFARHCVLKKTEGLNEELLRRPMVPSGTSLIGLVQHLIDSERYWFGYHVAGDQTAADLDFSMTVPADRDVSAILTGYQAAADASDDILMAIGDLDTPVTHPVDDAYLSVRWVLAHLTGETTRHAGHADIIRELLDGVTGR